MKVCEKVRNKGFTSYNEVADELVLEFAAGMHGSADSQVHTITLFTYNKLLPAALARECQLSQQKWLMSFF